MQCPKCNGPTWDNTQNKKNPKAPDFKCKEANGECKWRMTKSGWEPSDYPTGAWLPKPGKQSASVSSEPKESKSSSMPGEERGNLLKIVASLTPELRNKLAEEQSVRERYEMDGTATDILKMAGRALRRIGSELDTPNPNIPF